MIARTYCIVRDCSQPGKITMVFGKQQMALCDEHLDAGEALAMTAHEEFTAIEVRLKGEIRALGSKRLGDPGSDRPIHHPSKRG